MYSCAVNLIYTEKPRLDGLASAFSKEGQAKARIKPLSWPVLARPIWARLGSAPGFRPGRNSTNSAPSDLVNRIRAKLKKLLDDYRKMFDQSLSKSKDLGDMLRFLPGVVVQNDMSMQGMAKLYRIKPDLLERLIKSTVEPLRPAHVSPASRYRLDGYLSRFLQDRDRSQLSYCDPMIQHISICRHFLSLLEATNSFDLQS